MRSRRPRLSPRRLGLGLVAAAALAAGPAAAVPAFAIQTGRPCSACHVGGFGPQLTPFGREFKLAGYTLRTNTFNVPVSAMAIASYVHTASDAPPPPAKDFALNDNVAIDQVSLFIAGGAGEHVGGFAQITYDGVAHAFHWDNLDVRAITRLKMGEHSAVVGVTANNAPTVQDVFNTLPAWGAPYTSSSLAPAGPAAPLIGGLAQTTLGVSAYAWIDSQVYLEFGGYRSPGSGFLTHFGVDPTAPGDIAGTAPYARIAFDKNLGDRNFQIGAFGLWANIHPGLDRTTGQTDGYTDVGADGSVQLFAAHGNVATLNARFTHETQRLDASQILGLAARRRLDLEDARMDVSFYWRDKLGFTVQPFDTWGGADPLLYGGRTSKPTTTGVMLQVDGTPWGDGGSPLGPRFNLRLGVQYWAYAKFAGAAEDYDGMGRSAGANNTMRVFAWVAY